MDAGCLKIKENIIKFKSSQYDINNNNKNVYRLLFVYVVLFVCLFVLSFFLFAFFPFGTNSKIRHHNKKIIAIVNLGLPKIVKQSVVHSMVLKINIKLTSLTRRNLY
jgi:Na+-transporting NADH:ubiquinone oxidoreductase subunit NqrC